jgi:hypothetical protein
MGEKPAFVPAAGLAFFGLVLYMTIVLKQEEPFPFEVQNVRHSVANFRKNFIDTQTSPGSEPEDNEGQDIGEVSPPDSTKNLNADNACFTFPDLNAPPAPEDSYNFVNYVVDLDDS